MATLRRSHPFITHEAQALYLANGTFGGLQDGSATQLDLWSSSIASQNIAEPTSPILYPVTALHTAVWYQSPYYQEREFWIGRDGMITSDPRYTAHPAMPHLPQVYRIEQSLDLDTGVAECSGVLYPGSHAALEAGLAHERIVPYSVTTVFLKDSRLMLMRARSEGNTGIIFAPDFVLEERLKLDVSGRGICRIGSDTECALHLRKELRALRRHGSTIEAELAPAGSTDYRVRIDAPGAQVLEWRGSPALRAEGELTIFIQISPDGAPLAAPPSASETIDQQTQRWKDFWARSRVKLPAHESVWQERYQASLFYVAQSIGDGPTHPVGLSKPMYPHWFGCFHDTDTYFCRPLLESGRPELPFKHLSFRHGRLEQAKRIAKTTASDGAQFPWQCDLNGNGENRHSIMNSAIIAREAYFHAAMAGTEQTRRIAGAIVEESFRYLLRFTRDTGSGVELVDEPIETFSETMVVPKPTEALLAIRAVAHSLLEIAPDSALAPRAQRALRDLQPTKLTDGSIATAAGSEPEYMRCPSVTLGAFPLHVLSDRAPLERTFERELERVVFAFAWLPHQLSATAAQLGRREGAASAAGVLRLADHFYRDWHAIDEWENRRTGRAETFVTGAGGFATAIHHLLLAETSNGVWELFPATPESWKDVSFDGLVTRTGWRISATLAGGRLVHVSAERAHDRAATPLTLRCVFDGPARPAGGESWQVHE